MIWKEFKSILEKAGVKDNFHIEIVGNKDVTIENVINPFRTLKKIRLTLDISRDEA